MLSQQKIKIQIVVLMAKYHSPIKVMRELKKKGFSDIPSGTTIKTIYNKFLETGSVNDKSRSGRPSLRNEMICAIKEELDSDPSQSTRIIAAVVGASHTFVHKVMREDIGLYPYKVQYHQMLYEEDFANRAECCKDILEVHAKCNHFLEFLLTSDEATFHVNGQVNRHNCRIWGLQKPEAILNKSLCSPKVNVWIGLGMHGLLGPFFFDENVNGSNYLAMLNNNVVPFLKSKRRLSKTYFQQDGAPAHYAKAVRNFLDKEFHSRWIGRMGPISWPARSPDLSPLDFFLWGHLKTKVFSKKPKDLEHMKAIISEECAQISPDMCKNVMLTFVKRLSKCVEIDGRHVE